MSRSERPGQPWAEEIRASLRLAGPLVAAQLATVAMGVTDTIMLAMLGREALAGGALGVSVASTAVVVGGGLLSAVAPLASSARVDRRESDLRRVAASAAFLATGIAIPAMATLLAAPLALERLGEPAVAVEGARAYLRAFAFGVPAALGLHVVRQLLAALERTGVLALVTLGGALLNAVGDYVLMRGAFGLPALGIAGVALASTIVNWSMFLLLATFGRRRLGATRGLSPDAGLVAKMLRLGAPVALMFGAEIGLFAFTAIRVGRSGSAWLAAHQLVMQTTYVAYMVPHGISQAAAVRVALSLGRRDGIAARRAGIVAVAGGGSFMALVAALFLGAPALVIGMYLGVDGDDTLRASATRLLAVAAAFEVFDGVQVTAAGALRGFQDTRVPMLFALIGYVAVAIPASVILGRAYGPTGCWMGLAVGLAAVSVLLLIRLMGRARFAQRRPSA